MGYFNQFSVQPDLISLGEKQGHLVFWWPNEKPFTFLFHCLRFILIYFLWYLVKLYAYYNNSLSLFLCCFRFFSASLLKSLYWFLYSYHIYRHNKKIELWNITCKIFQMSYTGYYPNVWGICTDYSISLSYLTQHSLVSPNISHFFKIILQ